MINFLTNMPPNPKRFKSSHLETPKKAKARGTIEYLEAKGIEYTKTDVAKHFGLTRNQSYNSLTSGSDRTYNGRGGGYNKALSKEDLDLCEDLIKNNGFEGHTLT